MIQRVWADRFTTNILPHKFEAGTPNIADVIAFGAAVDYLSAVGLPAIGRHERELVGRALDVLRAESHVEVYGPADIAARGGVVSFNVGNIHPHDVGQVFDSEGVEVRVGHHCCQPLMRALGISGTVRASFYLYNTLDEVEAFARGLRKTKSFFKVGAREAKV